MFKNKPRRYIGILIVILSIAFFLAQLSPYLVSETILSPLSNKAYIISSIGIITGIYLTAGTLSALIALIPIVAGGCGGGGGPQPQPDLGPPPEPPSTAGHIIP